MAPGQKPFYIALGVVVVGGGIFIATRMTGGRPISIPANVVVTAADTTGFRGYVAGNPSAPVEVTEYADFQCPQCASFDQVQYPDVKVRLIDTNKMRLRFRDWPIDNLHSHTRVASHAAACANDQGRFWEVKDGLFRRQNDWAFRSNPMPIITEIIKASGADVATWDACMQSRKYAGRIQASLDEGTKLGVSGTPTFLIGGRLYPNIGSDEMARLVDSVIATLPPASAAKPINGGQ
jgi:protein-disulfide isomerase